MSSFGQYLRRQNAELKRITWICGPEKALVEETVDLIKTKLTNYTYFSVFADEISEKELWEKANQYPYLADEKILIVIRDAERLSNWSSLNLWLENSRNLPNVYLVFVSNTLSVYGRKDSQGAKEWLPPTILKEYPTKVSIVECKQPNNEDLIYWIRSKSRADDNVAQYLIDKVGGNVGKIHAFLQKIGLFGGKISEKAIDALCIPEPTEDFVTLLLSRNKKYALEALEKSDTKNARQIIGGLDYKLDILAVLNDCVSRGMWKGEIVRETKISQYVVQQLLPIAKQYDRLKLEHCRQVLADIDGYSDNVGAIEALVAMW